MFIIELVHEQLQLHTDDTPVREEAYFADAKLDDEELRAAGKEDHERRKAQRARQAEAATSNLGLGHDLRAGLIDPTPSQLQALKAIVCHLLARHYRDVIAYGAGLGGDRIWVSAREVVDDGFRAGYAAASASSNDSSRSTRIVKAHDWHRPVCRSRARP